jgi:hypothetical protein
MDLPPHGHQTMIKRLHESGGNSVEAAEQAGAEVYLGHTRFTALNAVEVEGRMLRFRKTRSRDRGQT